MHMALYSAATFRNPVANHRIGPRLVAALIHWSDLVGPHEGSKREGACLFDHLVKPTQ
jgi:hypothetical protein